MKSNKLRVIIPTLLLALTMSACDHNVGAGNGQSAPSTLQSVGDVVDKNVDLGQGILGKSFVVTPSKIIEEVPGKTPTLRGDNLASKIYMTQTIDKSIKANDLGINGSLNAEISSFKGSLAGEYADATKEANTTISTDYGYISAGEYHYAQPTKDLLLNSAAMAMFSKDKDEFYRQYGDSFVNSVRAGIALFANLKFEFKDEKTKNKIAANVNLASDPVQVAADITKEVSGEKNSVTVKVYVTQFGGDVGAATSIFKEGQAKPLNDKEDDSIYVFQCSLDNFEACNNFLKNINNYISGKSSGSDILTLPQQVAKYQKSGTVTQDDVSQLYIFGPAATNLNSLGEALDKASVIEYKYTPYELLATEGNLIPKFEFSNAVEKIQNTLTNYYMEANNNLIFLNSYFNLLAVAGSSGSISSELREKISSYKDLIETNLVSKSELLKDCFSPQLMAGEKCETSFAKFKETYSSQNASINKFNLAYRSSGSGTEFYLLPSGDDEYVSWSNSKSSYSPNGVNYYITNDFFGGVTDAEAYADAYKGKYIFTTKSEDITCSVTLSNISCTNPKNKLDKNTLKAMKITKEGEMSEESGGFLLSGTFTAVDNPLKIQ